MADLTSRWLSFFVCYFELCSRSSEMEVIHDMDENWGTPFFSGTSIYGFSYWFITIITIWFMVDVSIVHAEKYKFINQRQGCLFIIWLWMFWPIPTWLGVWVPTETAWLKMVQIAMPLGSRWKIISKEIALYSKSWKNRNKTFRKKYTCSKPFRHNIAARDSTFLRSVGL